MVKFLTCSYCGDKVPPGTGTIFVRNTGEVLNFCTNKCKNLRLVQKRPARKVRWTKYYGKK